MDGAFFDGRTSRPHQVEVAISEGALLFEAGGTRHAWPLEGLRVEVLGDRVRLSCDAGADGRLTLSRADWRAVLGRHGRRVEARGRRREGRVVLSLAAVGLTMAAIVFVGLPAASGPLARHTPPDLERQIGDSFDAQLGLGMKTCSGGEGQAALARFGHQLQARTGTPFDIRVRAVRAPFANAMALPGGRILVTDKLIAFTRTPDELSAVIAHEVAHVERRHVMQAMWRSLGAGLLLDLVVGGGSGAGQQAVLLAGSASDLRYSRRAEAEADARGMELLQAEGLSSQGMAPFFRRVAAGDGEKAASPLRELVSSHPDSLRRAQVSAAHARPGAAAFDTQAWASIRAACPPARAPH